MDHLLLLLSVVVVVAAEPVPDERDELPVGDGVPDAVRSHDDEVPRGVEAVRDDLRHDGDDLLPRRLVHLALEQEVAERAGGDEHSADPEKPNNR